MVVVRRRKFKETPIDVNKLVDEIYEFYGEGEVEVGRVMIIVNAHDGLQVTSSFVDETDVTSALQRAYEVLGMILFGEEALDDEDE